MAEGIIPGPNFKFQTREMYWPRENDGWPEWTDVNPGGENPRIVEEDGHFVLEMSGADEYVHQVRIVFLPEESSVQ